MVSHFSFFLLTFGMHLFYCKPFQGFLGFFGKSYRIKDILNAFKNKDVYTILFGLLSQGLRSYFK